MRLKKVYVSERVDCDFTCDEDGERPSWIKLDLDYEPTFLKVEINDEEVIYERFLPGNYFIPLKATPEDYEEFYNEYSENYEKVEEKNQTIRKAVIKEVKKFDKTSRILEAGAGTGGTSKGLIQQGYKNITLLDISEEMLKIAKTKINNENVEFVKKNILEVEKENEYDVIITELVLHYFKNNNRIRGIKKLKTALKTEGTLISVDAKKLPFEKEFNNVTRKTVKMETKDNIKPFILTIAKK